MNDARVLSILVLLTAAGAAAGGEGLPADEATAKIDFQRQVKPILSERCFACHGPDADRREADLRLDTSDGATADMGGYAAVVPGDPDASELIARIAAEDPADAMPPPDMGPRLSEAEVQVLRAWVSQGAAYSQHWSYVPPVRSPPPAVADLQWSSGAIDRHVLAALEAEGLAPSPTADRYTLIRRLSLDLTGLPPTPQQADAFAADRRPDAYRRLVDAMLANPAFAERWASVWLDLARYADSAGYADDPPRTIWAYRDYVIRAFADNLPLDRFTREQIAGDLLPNPSDEALIATAFHRNTMTNSEGGTDDEEFRSAAIVDRVNTTMAVWMGTTMACAQCHTHKYDPITQEEYFRFYAFFNNTADADLRDESPVVPVYDAQQKARRAELEQQLKSLQQELREGRPTLSAEQAVWERRIAGASESTPAQFVRIDLPGKQRFLSLAEVQVFRDGKNVALQGTATQSSTAFDGPPQKAVDDNTDGHYEKAHSVTHTAAEKDPWWEVDLGQPQSVDSVVVWNRTDNQLQSRLDGFRVTLLDAQRQVVFQKQFKKAPKAEQAVVVSEVPADIAIIARLDPPDRSGPQQQRIGTYFRQRQITSLQQAIDDIKPATTVPVMRELADNRRETFVQIRGNYRDTADRVEPGVPEVFHPLPDSAAADRRALADWLVDRRNPLTARVIANRVWEQLFGTGLVATSEEFGSQGELPSHPQLLDDLAVELVDSGWDFKQLVRRIVCSATYQQSATVTPDLLQRDPDNRLLSRGPRFRVDAEMVRDQALAVSGLLSRTMFGPPVHPPRPVLNLKAAFGGSTDWQDSRGADRYRRGLYTEWRRSMPYPSMTTFDMPSREVCTLNRGRTNTPLQALITLNDPVYIEAAQALARRTLREQPDADDAQRIAHALRLCLIRPPEQDEVDALLRLLDQARQWYADRPDEAVKMATEPIGPVPETLAAVTMEDMAAWTVVGNVLLNLDEVLQK